MIAGEFARARAGELRVVLVVGDAGIGKTALAAEAAARAGKDAVVLTARAHALALTSPFGVWVEALERYLRTLEAERVRELTGPAAVELAPLLRSVEASRPDQASRETSSYRLVESFVALLASIAAQAPAVLVLDDVHLADAASWETLRFLARDRPGIPALILATARPGELAEAPVASDAVFALEQEGTLRRLRLKAMGRDELAELARLRTNRDLVPWALVSWLEERSRGNVLFALGLLSALLDEGADLAHPSLAAIPEDLSDRVLARLRGLDDEARSMLELLGVLGARVELADLGRIAGRPIEVLAGVLEELIKRGLVDEDDRGPRPSYEVAHPLVQDAVYGSILAGRRSVLHRKIGRSLLASGQLATGAAHLARSAGPGDPEAVDALVAALREAEERSLYRSATAIMSELVKLLPAGDQRWLRVLDVMRPDAEWVLAHLAEDHAGEAYEAMWRIEQLVEAEGDDLRRGIVQLRLACFGGVPRGRVAEALERCGRAADLFLRAGEDGLALAARAESAYLLAMRGENGAGIELARDVLASASGSGEALARMHALAYLGWTLSYVGAFDEAEHHQASGIELAGQVGSHYRASLFRQMRALSLAYMGRLTEASAIFGDIARGNPAAVDALLYENEIAVRWMAGDLDGALVAAAKAAARNRQTVSVRQAAYLALGARAAIEADRLEGAEGVIRRTRRASEGFASVWSVYPDWASGVLAWRLGRPEAVDELLAAARRIRELDAPAESMWILLDVAEAASVFGSPEATRWAAEEAAAAAPDLPLYTALRDLTAAIAGEGGDGARAAAGVLADLGYRLWLGRAQLTLGCALARTDTVAAVAALEEGVDTFRACGAAWHLDRSLEVLRALGSRGKRAAAAVAGPAALTAREAEVARLAAGGMTAREIGEALYIGKRTVETHLRQAYAKLGVRTKRELVRRAGELGLRT